MCSSSYIVRLGSGSKRGLSIQISSSNPIWKAKLSVLFFCSELGTLSMINILEELEQPQKQKKNWRSRNTILLSNPSN